MRLAFFILVFLSIVASSCKKETKKIVPENPESSCVCLKENIGIGTINQTTCNGFLTITTYTDATVGKNFSHGEVMGYFNDKASTQMNGNFVTVDSVLLDGQHLKIVNDAYSEPMYYWSYSSGQEQ